MIKMFNINNSLSGYINHLEEMSNIVLEVARGHLQILNEVGDVYSWEDIHDMEDELYTIHGITIDLSCLHK